jgi:hypothetical protein
MRAYGVLRIFEISRFQDCNIFKIATIQGFQDFKIRRCQDFKMSRSQDFNIFKISKIEDVKISRCQDLRISTFSRFQDLNSSRLQGCQSFNIPLTIHCQGHTLGSVLIWCVGYAQIDSSRRVDSRGVVAASVCRIHLVLLCLIHLVVLCLTSCGSVSYILW